MPSRFFEVDLPSSVRKKVHLVARCIPDFAGAGDVRWVAADLSEVKLQPTLATAGFDPRLPTCVTIGEWLSSIAFYPAPCPSPASLHPRACS